MIKLVAGGSSINVYDVRRTIERYEALGLSTIEMKDWNTFTYAIFPEGSHGKFVIAADEAQTINTGKFEIKLEISDVNAGTGFYYDKLAVRSVMYFEVPVDTWDISGATGLFAETRKVAVVELVDYSSDMDDVIDRDYNRITKLAPKDTDNKYESTSGALKTFQQIITDIFTNNPIGGTPLTLTATGLPADFKPKNVLIAGSSMKDVLELIANAHFLVVFVDVDGKVVMTNQQTTSELVPLQNSLVYTQYGPPIAPDKVNITFSENSDQASKQRTTLLVDYRGNTNTPWNTDFIEPDNTTDPTLPNVEKMVSDGNSDCIYYPFLEHDVYGEKNADAEYTALLDALKDNYEARTLRTVKIAYKQLVNIKPSATISKVKYIYSDSGLITSIESLPPEKLAVPPLTNHVGRGLEFVPPFLRGKVTSGGADYTSTIPGYPACEAIDAAIPDDPIELEVELPALTDDLDPLKVKVYSVVPYQIVEDSEAGFFFNVHTRRYEYVPLGEDIIEFVINSISTSESDDYYGLKIANVTIKRDLHKKRIDKTVDVVDHSDCVFDKSTGELAGIRGWGSWGVAKKKVGVGFTPYHWCADNRCCTAAEMGLE